MRRKTLSKLWRLGLALFLAAFSAALSALPVAAEDAVDDLTIYGTNRSKISGSPLTDTRSIESTVKIEKPQIEDGLKAGESQVEREATPVEKPKMDESKREKLDVTPDVKYRVDWKLTLLIGLLEAAGK